MSIKKLLHLATGLGWNEPGQAAIVKAKLIDASKERVQVIALPEKVNHGCANGWGDGLGLAGADAFRQSCLAYRALL